MRTAALSRMVRGGAAAMRGLLGNEDGQAATEYSLLSFYIILGGGGAIFAWMPAMLNAYTIYIHGFYTVLGLPVP